MSKQKFQLIEVLALVTGNEFIAKWVATGFNGEPLRILLFMAGPAALRNRSAAESACREEILRQHPSLQNLKVPEFQTYGQLEVWLGVQKTRFGAELALSPLKPGKPKS